MASKEPGARFVTLRVHPTVTVFLPTIIDRRKTLAVA